MASNRTRRALAFTLNNSNSEAEASEPSPKRSRTNIFELPMRPPIMNESELNATNYLPFFAQRSRGPAAAAPEPEPMSPAPPTEIEEEEPVYVNEGVPVPGTPARIRRNLESVHVNNINNSTYEFIKCVKVGDKYHFVSKPRNLSPNTISGFPVIEVHSIEQLLDQPGVYTWVLTIGQVSRADDMFAARIALTPGEIKSKHKNILRNLRTNQIVLAGEVLVREGPDVTFNFISGTYMPRIKNRHRRGRSNEELNELFSNYMRDKFLAAGVPLENIHFNPGIAEADSLITSETTMEALQPYLDAGYTISPGFSNLNSCERANPLSGGKRTKKIARHRRRKTRR